MKREFTLLAHDYDPERHNINGWYISEKLDGQRAIWLPKTRGLRFVSVRFANSARDTRNPICTGLWSRYGKVIHAPDWFLARLPTEFNLDGELWAGRGKVQDVSSCVRKLIPADNEWKHIKYMCFDSPSDSEFWKAGQVRNPNYSYLFDGEIPKGFTTNTPLWKSFPDFLNTNLGYNETVMLHEQRQLPFPTAACMEELDTSLKRVLQLRGEGLIARNYVLTWTAIRSHYLVKIKPEIAGEGIVVGWNAGKGKLKGLFGSLIIKWNSILFELSGFTDYERALVNSWPKHFAKDSTIKFKYRETTDGGVPKEAHYDRSIQACSIQKHPCFEHATTT